MRIEELKDICTACGACLSVCPKQCIAFAIDSEGFYYPHIDKEKCISCGKCERYCHCLNQQEVTINRHSYYGYSLDSKVRESSTSGGVFSSLAENVLQNDGAVYGAAFDYDRLWLKHQSTDVVSLEDLKKSKYIESYMGDTILQIKKDLDRGRKVLFCGTPCQAAGVRHVLGQNNNLLICDFICHGVPSAGIFKDYIEKKLKKNEKLTGLDFRPKDTGWSSKNIKLVISTTTTTVTPYFLDIFYKGFMHDNAFLRRSCYACRYRTNHFSDITIADFWGYREVDPNLNDEKGLSLIVTNTAKGQEAVECLQNFELHEIDNKYSEYAFKERDYSHYMDNRKHFYQVYKPGELKKAALQTYMADYYYQWFKYRIKKLLGRI